MKSHLTKEFIKLFNNLPNNVKILAKKNYSIWKSNPYHKSLNFKETEFGTNIYSIRIGIGWRALGVLKDDRMIWFWIGSHSDYDKIIK